MYKKALFGKHRLFPDQCMVSSMTQVHGSQSSLGVAPLNRGTFSKVSHTTAKQKTWCVGLPLLRLTVSSAQELAQGKHKPLSKKASLWSQGQGRCLNLICKWPSSSEEGEDRSLEMQIAEELGDQGGVEEQRSTGEQRSAPDHGPLITCIFECTTWTSLPSVTFHLCANIFIMLFPSSCYRRLH